MLQVQEAQYSALEQEHAQLQVQLEAQLEIIADKETQQQQELANAVESLTVAHATQQRLEEVNAAFEQQVSSMSLQLSDMQSKIQSPQKMMQQQQELATALESLQAAHAAQQQLKADKAALVKEVDSMSTQLSDTQSKLHLAQKASEEAEATSLEFSAQMEALQEELANQREADAGETAGVVLYIYLSWDVIATLECRQECAKHINGRNSLRIVGCCWFCASFCHSTSS